MQITAIPLKTDSLSWYPYSKTIEENLTIETKYGDIVKLSKKMNGHIGVPRQLAPLGTIDARTIGVPFTQKVMIPPRNDEQVRVIKESTTLLKNGESHIIQATTGFGKTYCGVSIAANLGLPTLIIVTKEDLMGEAQWKGALKKFLGLKDSDIGLIQQDVCDYKGKKFVLAMVHSLAKDKYPEEIKSYFGLVIFDEVHRMGADTFSEACGMFNAKLRLGLSATPNRVDGKEFIFKAHIGQIRVKTTLLTLPPKVIFQNTKFKLPMVTRRVNGDWKKIPLPHSPAKMMGVYKAMAADQKRNDMLLDFIYSAWKKGRKIIAFSELRESHLEILYWQAVKRGIPAEDMGFYVGGLTEAERKHVKTKRLIWATYRMASEATDIPALDTAVLCLPRANIVQIVGRILRELEGKKEPVVFDPVDNCSSILTMFMSKRRTDYMRLKAKLLYV
jgi:superfamily II DNA or RNA helicase